MTKNSHAESAPKPAHKAGAKAAPKSSPKPATAAKTRANAPAKDGYVAAIDLGTTSVRCIIFDHNGEIVDKAQREFKQIFPQKGWVEHDAEEIWKKTRKVVGEVLTDSDIGATDIRAVGITNQRETAVVWDKHTGKPVYNAIVWQDTRTAAICEELGGEAGADRWKQTTGLPLSTYFAGPKVKWILDNVAGAREKAEAGDLLFGTIDSWTIWNLTGGAKGEAGKPALHITDVTNASRTLLMDLHTLSWNEEICQEMGIPLSMLPEIRSSSENYGTVRKRDALAGTTISGILGDQQAATFGQTCTEPGEAKNTYGTGNFMLLNTGTEPQFSTNGLLTTVCYRLGDAPAVYALEGSIAVTGSLIQWLRDNLQILEHTHDVEALAQTVEDNGGVYFVPAFSGLLAPHWRPDARGVIAGLTRFVNKGHIARAALESVAYQTREVVDAMNRDVSENQKLHELKVDGGMTKNNLLMQFQSDLLEVPVVRPSIYETTALGAAYAAGLAVGFWDSVEELREKWSEDARWSPQMSETERNELTAKWDKAVQRTLDWED